VVHTYAAYGFNLGGPGNWAFTGVKPGRRLVVPWYDETDPTHDFAARATTEIARGLHHELSLRRRIAYEIQTPFFFESVIDVSPPGWTREASAPPPSNRTCRPRHHCAISTGRKLPHTCWS
jgi:hypothetical protein